MIDYTEKIPNNVDLGRDRVLQRALEHWQPAFLGWWSDMGPNETIETRIFGRLSAWQNWIFIRPNAVGPDGALKVYGTGAPTKFNWERV